MKFSAAQLRKWQRSPAGFIETQLVDPVTNKPFVLLPAERAFIDRAFQVNEETGRLRYPEMIYATPRKGGKTAFAGAASTSPAPSRAPGPVFIPGPRPSWLQEAVEAQLERFGHHIERRDVAPGITPVDSLGAIGAIFHGDAERQKSDSMFFNGGTGRRVKIANNRDDLQ